MPAADWNGEERGYRIHYQPTNGATDAWKTALVGDENANSHVLSGLEEWTEYSIRVAAYNKVGHSEDSPVVTDSTREAGMCSHTKPGHTQTMSSMELGHGCAYYIIVFTSTWNLSEYVSLHVKDPNAATVMGWPSSGIPPKCNNKVMVWEECSCHYHKQ